MAESSSTSASTSTAANSDYDVFVNHRGPDVKKNFASHLYRRLISHGLRVFLDQPELQRGDDLTRQIEGAISSASVHVAIFSSRYAESAWCLKELVLMRESNSPIIPVFYHAKPSDLLAIKGRYARALEALKMKTASDPRTGEVNPRYDSNTIEDWRTALSSVKEIVGFDLEACNSDEGELVDKVVEGVLRKVKKPALDVATYPTGLDDKINDFENTVLLPLQQSGKPQILGIVGLGGVGKTTLAKEFFNRKKSVYSSSCFLFDVRDYARKGTLNLVQRNLLKCLTGSDHPIDSVAEGIARLRTHPSLAKALVIIDDVDHENHLDALLPHQIVLNSNSLILITSRNKNVLTRRVENTSIYKLTGLNPPHAEELFCSYAFNQPHPFTRFKSQVNKFLETCDGLPLSLKVFGALLNRNYDQHYWQYLLEKLEVPSEIQDKLQISFDSLTVTEQKIFLDMACFFIGEDRDMAIKIWEGSGWEGSGWNGLRDFQNIQDKCLVEVDSENKIKMHDHLRDLGRDLAKAPGLPRRLWSWKENDIEDLLQQSSKVPVRGIKLVSSEYNDIDVEDALSGIRMRSLQLLDGEGVLVEHILAKVPSPNLRWLRWKNCPCSSLPSSISMKNLRVLHLEGERLRTLWQNESQAPLELRELEITNHHLNILNSVGKLKHLERIVIRPWNRIGLFQFVQPKSAEQKIKGFMVIQKKNVLDLNDFNVGIIRSQQKISNLFGMGVSLQLVSTSQIDSSNGIGKLSKNALPQNWISTVLTGQTTYGIEFHWDSNFGIPGAFFITNSHHHEFFLNSLTLQVHGHVYVHFDCNSWVYPASTYNRGRVFFSNRSYLPANSPPALIKLRNEELRNLRGEYDGMAETERKASDRVYDYDFYNDLGNPDKNMELSRPVLGGSQQFPYPRRGRTGRPRTKTEPATESRLALDMSLDIYVPRDERFGHRKLSDFLAYALKSVAQYLVPVLKFNFDSTPNEFDSFEDVMKLYSDGIKLHENSILDSAKSIIPLHLIKEFFTTDGQQLLKYPLPQVISNDKFAWRKDEEFARQMLAGVDPVVIQGLKSFPPRSKLDPEMYGPQISSLTASHIEKNLDGLTVDQALEENKLFILDHHDVFMPYVNRINALSTKIYASRTILFLKKDATLRPVAIELSLPPSDQHRESVRKVFTPAEEGAQGALWQLAKAYVAVNDSGYHQLISHWLKTHAVTEPFVIATNRQLSVMHPVYKLLSPHFRDTMNINALVRQTLINAGGILERTVFPGKYAMEMSAVAYKDWRFDEQGLPADLLNRGMAVVDSSMPHGLKLMIEDYPYAVDGLEIWFAIVSWVKEYLSLYYQNDDAVKSDTELQAWWSEIRNVGHGDKKDETWWYSMENVEEVEKALTTIIWAASALHAAVNFGQYPYAGYMPDRPTISRRLIPEEGSQEFSDLVENPDLFFLGTVSNQFQTTLGIALIEILSRHSTDEVYLGQRATSDWTEDEHVAEAFERFGMKLKEIEKNITERNQDVGKLKNRSGPAQIPYTLLYPNTSDVSHQGGLTGKGIPNSASI